MPFLLPSQQRQSTEGSASIANPNLFTPWTMHAEGLPRTISLQTLVLTAQVVNLNKLSPC